MDRESCKFLMAYTGAEVKTLRHLSLKTGGISERSFICVKRLHREFSCIQTTSCTRNWKPLLAGTKKCSSNKHLVWKGTISFISKLMLCGSIQLNSGEKFDVKFCGFELWMIITYLAMSFFYYEWICDFILCALYLKCMKCELGWSRLFLQVTDGVFHNTHLHTAWQDNFN